jgi:ethanolamine utilization protein EutA
MEREVDSTALGTIVRATKVCAPEKRSGETVRRMSGVVQLVGLDFGTTTMSAVIAEAHLTRNAVSGRTDLDGIRERFRSEMVFTPLVGERIDEASVARQLDDWLEAGGVRSADLFGGGALLTGLTAQRDNAAALVRLIRARLGDALIATANDPCLESWLAFVGSCVELSRDHPNLRVLNLDVGGGTTNLALGQAGEVSRTGCLFVGARHVHVEPGTYRIARLSRYARALLEHLHVRKDVAATLTGGEVDAILTYYVDLLNAAMCGDRSRLDEPTARLHEQVCFRPPADDTPVVITLSGGVGELVYAHLDGQPWPATTAFGDLGIDLAQRLVQTDWAKDLRRYRVASAGRATVYGLLRHSTDISGSTIYLPHPEILPLSELPILGTVSAAASSAEVEERIALAARCERGACLRVEVGSHEAAAVRDIGQRIAAALAAGAFPAHVPLVLLVSENVGKLLGQYGTRWGKLPVQLVVIDELPVRQAQYARIGRPRQNVVPATFFGLMQPSEDARKPS